MTGDDVRLVDNGGLMWACYEPNFIGIDNLYKWFENMIVEFLTHETIHHVIYELENYDTTNMFDSLFGSIEPSLMLVPIGEGKTYRLKRVENFWNALQKV